MSLIDEQAAAAKAGTWPQVDRRRPNRPESVSAELVPLLRGGISSVPDLDTAFGDPDQLRAARGLAWGAVISCGLWAGLAYMAYLVIP